MSRAPDRDLTLPELRELAAELAVDQALWGYELDLCAERRTYRRILDGAHASAWLIGWMAGHDTGFHDHDGAAGAVAVMAGRVREERLRLGGSPVGREYGAGGTFAFGGSDIHRVRHVGDEPAITVHVYSPRLRRMGTYVESESGVLLRHALDEDAELVAVRAG